MGMPNSVEEIDAGMIQEGIDSLDYEEEAYREFMGELNRLQRRSERLADKGYGYWLDNCGDGVWYCEHCLQEECGKRMAERKLL